MRYLAGSGGTTYPPFVGGLQEGASSTADGSATALKRLTTGAKSRVKKIRKLLLTGECNRQINYLHSDSKNESNQIIQNYKNRQEFIPNKIYFIFNQSVYTIVANCNLLDERIHINTGT